MTNKKCITGLMLGAAAGGMLGAILDRKNRNTLVGIGKKMLKKCTGVLSDLL